MISLLVGEDTVTLGLKDSQCSGRPSVFESTDSGEFLPSDSAGEAEE